MQQSEELLKVYFEEGEELIAGIEGSLLLLEREGFNPDAINSAFRFVHTLKGNSAMLGFHATSEFTHALENEFDQFRSGKSVMTKEQVSRFLTTCDFLRTLVNHDRLAEQIASEKLDAMIAFLSGSAAAAEVEANSPPSPATENSNSGFEIFSAAPTVPDRFPAQTPSHAPAEPVRQDARGASDFQLVGDVSPVARASAARHTDPAAARPRATDSRSIRVDTSKIEGLVNLAGEISVMQSMLSELAVRREADKYQQLESTLSQIERSTQELQQRVLSVRMMPVGTLLGNYTRLVRDLAASQRKEISLSIVGEEAELDRSIMEQVRDPLTHIIRNAVDHGIELPEDRVACGKPAAGKLELRAAQEGSQVVISVTDDGSGIKKARVLEKAVALGLVGPEENLSEEEILSLIFHPGFSTAETITAISGRGVGLDVVKRNIELIGGEVSIRSAEGRGTSIALRLPLTLAIIEGLVTRIGSESYIVPSSVLVETRQPKEEDIKTAGGVSEVVRVRDRYLPLIRLHEFFKVEGAVTEPHRAICLVVQYNERQFCAMADEVMGYQQVVIKSLGRFFSSAAGVSGAAILADGRIALIVDIASTLRQTVLWSRKIA